MNLTSLPYGGPKLPASVTLADLSETERDVLELLCDGYSNAQIANELELPLVMVAGCSSTLKMVFRARNRAHVAALAIRAGLLNGKAA